MIRVVYLKTFRGRIGVEADIAAVWYVQWERAVGVVRPSLRHFETQHTIVVQIVVDGDQMMR